MKNDNEQRWQPVGVELAYACDYIERERSPQQNLHLPRNVALFIHKLPYLLESIRDHKNYRNGKRRYV
jgi:hypothetical protein